MTRPIEDLARFYRQSITPEYRMSFLCNLKQDEATELLQELGISTPMELLRSVRGEG